MASINRAACIEWQYATYDHLFACTYYPSPSSCSTGYYKVGTANHGAMTQAQYNSVTATPTTLVFADCGVSPCTPCNNAVNNSHYTTYGTVPTSNCQWVCDTNYILFLGACTIVNCPAFTTKTCVNVCTPCAAGKWAAYGTEGACGTCTYMMAGTAGVYTEPGSATS